MTYAFTISVNFLTSPLNSALDVRRFFTPATSSFAGLMVGTIITGSEFCNFLRVGFIYSDNRYLLVQDSQIVIGN